MSGTSLPLDPSLLGLGRCGCCAGVRVSTPRQVWNRAGLPAIAYRIGTHGDFKASLLARLGSPDFPALGALSSRDDADPTVALLDAVATMAEIVTFYQERIANEAYLRTATQWRSLAGLARLTGYQPSPGLAATAVLAFTLDDTPGAAEVTTVPAGTRVQSVPAAGQLPQTFETGADFEGRPEWNAMPALTAVPHPVPTAATTSILVAGLVPQLRAGDRLLLADPSGAVWPKQVCAATPDPATQTTRVDLQPDALPPVAAGPPPRPAITAIYDIRPLLLGTDAVSSTILAQAWRGADLLAQLRSLRWALPEVMAGVRVAAMAAQATAPPGCVVRFRQHAAIFGHNAPWYASLPGATLQNLGNDWDTQGLTLDFTWAANAPGPSNGTLQLDRSYGGIGAGGWVLLEDGAATPLARQVASDGDTSAVAFTQSLRVTQVSLQNTASADLSGFTRRGTTVWCDSETLTLAPVPVRDPVSGDTLALGRIYLGLQAGQYLAVSGTRTDLAGVAGTELTRIADVVVQGDATWLTLDPPLANQYDRRTVTANANVVVATNGLSVAETVGSGDSSQPFQQFALRQPPLTFVADPDSGGPASTLAIRVNGEAWTEVPTLFGAMKTDRVFVSALDDTGTTRLVFGDGTNGARLPTGTGNVTAAYRTGIGSPGLVSAGAVCLLATRPLGVRSVVNPAPTTDAADMETPAMLRASAPLHVLTLDRIVSLDDYANYARAYPGIGKALASWTWSPRGRAVVMTVAGPDGASIDPGAPLGRSLVAAVAARSDPTVPVALADYQPVYVQVGAAVKTDPSLIAAAVLVMADSALRAAFAFDARDFGQPIAASEVVAVLQGVAGVVACDLTLFCRPPDASGVASFLAAAVPPPGAAAGSAAAEILLLDPRPIPFTVLLP